MRYFAGLFDAEGYVSLVPSGHFRVGIVLTNLPLLECFQREFGGKIYKNKRKTPKTNWEWAIVTNTEEMNNFLKKITPFSIVKQTQLQRLLEYLTIPKKSRASIRKEYSSQIAAYKVPSTLTRSDFPASPFINPTTDFYEWMAGFLDGDGNLCIYEYKSKFGCIIFDSWIGVFNTHGECIQHVQKHVMGSISHYKSSKFPIWKWVCCQKDSLQFCEKILPFLVLKKGQAQCLIDFFEIKKTKTKASSYTFDQINEIRSLISQIKHLNSL